MDQSHLLLLLHIIVLLLPDNVFHREKPSVPLFVPSNVLKISSTSDETPA